MVSPKPSLSKNSQDRVRGVLRSLEVPYDLVFIPWMLPEESSRPSRMPVRYEYLAEETVYEECLLSLLDLVQSQVFKNVGQMNAYV